MRKLVVLSFLFAWVLIGFAIWQFKEGLDSNPIYLGFSVFFMAGAFIVSLLLLAFAISISNIEKLKESKVFVNIYPNYYKTFDVSNDDEKTTQTHADLYFNAEELCEAKFHFPLLSIFKLFAGTFVGLGILGTFIGFSSGLPADFDEEQIKLLLSGLKTAFNTSIIGVVTSILYNFLVVQPILNSLNQSAQTLCDELDSKYYISDTLALSKDIQALGASLQSGIGDMSKAINETMSNFGGDIKSSVSASFEKAIEGSREALNAAMTESAEKLSKISEILDKTPENLTAVNDATNNLSEKLSQKITEAGEQTKSQLAAVVSTIHNELNKEFETFSNNLTPASEAIKDSTEKLCVLPEILKESISAITDGANAKMAQTLNGFNAKINESITKFTDGIKPVCDNLDTTSTKIAEIPEMLKESFNDVSENTKSGIENMLNGFDSKIGDSLENFTDRLQPVCDNLTETSNKISEIPQQITDSFSKVSESAKDGISEITNTANSKMSNTMDNFSEKIENSLNGFTENFEPIAESMERASKEIATVPATLSQLQQNLKVTSDILSSKMSDFAKKQDDLNDTRNEMARTLAGSANNLKDLIEGVKNATLEYERLNTSTKDLFNEFQNVDKALQNAFKSVEQALQNYTQNTQDTVSEYMDKFAQGTQNYTSTFMSSIEEVKQFEQNIEQSLEKILRMIIDAQNKMKKNENPEEKK